MRHWLVGKQISRSALGHVTTYCLGSVELRAQDSLTPDERAALTESAEHEGLVLEHFKHAPVACARVEADDELTANEIADGTIAEVLDALEAFGSGGVFSRHEILSASFVRSLDSGSIHPGRSREFGWLAAKAFKMRNWFFEPMDQPRLAFSARHSELGRQIHRSIHWWRRSRSTKDGQLALLWRWFAIEALCKVRVEETDITPRVRWFLGFPSGAAQATLPRHLVQRWTSQPNYELWRRKTIDWLHAIRDFRNDCVHAGFRFSDIDIGKLRQLTRVADFVCPNLHRAAYRALTLGAETRSDLADHIDIVFAEWNPERFFERMVDCLS